MHPKDWSRYSTRRIGSGLSVVRHTGRQFCAPNQLNLLFWQQDAPRVEVLGGPFRGEAAKHAVALLIASLPRALLDPLAVPLAGDPPFPVHGAPCLVLDERADGRHAVAGPQVLWQLPVLLDQEAQHDQVEVIVREGLACM